MSRIILNADDFGHSEDTVRATIECFERGALTSATIMPNMPATRLAIEYTRGRRDLSFGVHLTFVNNEGERPLSDPSKIPSLVGPDGAFTPGGRLFYRAFFRRVPVAEIRREMEAQIAFLADHGVRISHVDSHGHMHKVGPFVDALRAVLPRFGIERVRRGQNLWLTKPYRSPSFWLGGSLHPNLRNWFRTTDRFFMPICKADAEGIEALLGRLRAKSIEIGVHPGFAEDWRDLERRAIQDLAPKLKARKHELIGWGAL